MKCKYLFLLSAAILASCGKSYELNDTQFNEESIRVNTEKQLGITIDPEQTWADITNGSITIKADADLEDIVKVQILTESPFGNDEAAILNSADCQKGDVVTLNYEAPGDATELVAACVSSKGVYYIKVFNIGESNLSFASTANARTRGTDDEYPTLIELGDYIPSFNAERALASEKSGFNKVLVKDNTNGGNNRYYDVWADGSWKNDRLWSHKTVKGGNWNVESGFIYRSVSNSGDMNTLKSIITTYLKKTGGENTTGTTNKRNNWQDIATGNAYFRVNNSYLISNGGPTTLIPIQMFTTEGDYNTIYYYYFNSKSIPAGMSEVDYIKTLPKFKAIPGKSGDATCRREKEYLLPYYGDGTPSDIAVSVAIPKGYQIGFLNRKDFKNMGDISNCGSGCIYGDGRLNFEVNHLKGHYFSAMDKELSQEISTDLNGSKKDKCSGNTPSGMQWTSPRIGFFSANKHSYMCFEDGADCNFCDMVIEVVQGTEIIEEDMVSEDIPGASYLMCFEDRPAQADYDMNDVVIYAKRINNKTIEVGLAACGAADEVYIMGIPGGRQLNNSEIHDLFGIPKETFAHTKTNGQEVNRIPRERITTDLSLEDFMRSIYIVNKTTEKTIRMPEKGKSPYVIIVPDGFRYPKEGTSIKSAYPGFLEWAQNRNASRNWYKMYDDISKIFPDLFIQ
jgi:hypothetical protein